MDKLWKQESPVKVASIMASVCFFTGIIAFIPIEIIGGERELGGFAYYGPVVEADVKYDMDISNEALKNYRGGQALAHTLAFRARAFNFCGEPKLALECCDKALAIKPDKLSENNYAYIMAYAERALAYSLLNDCERAHKDIEQSIKLDSDQYYSNKIMGKILVNEEHYNEAIEYFTKALNSSPDDNIVLIDRARVYYKLRQYEKCIADIDRAINQREFSFYYEFKGIAYIALGRYKDSIKSLNMALLKDPALASAYKHRAKCYKKLGDIRSAQYNLAQYEKLKQIKNL